MQVAIDQFGRMVLPKPLRDDFHLMPGDQLEASSEGDAIVLRPVREATAVRMKDGVLVVSATATGDLREALARHRQERLGREAGRRRRP